MPTRRVQFNKWSRKLHRWGAVATLIPFALVIVTGLLLQVKKQWAWVQPETMRSPQGPMAPGLTIGFDGLLEAARSVPEAGISGWSDVDRIDVRPGRGVAKVRSTSRWEVQIDTATGAVLASGVRRSDLIESLHDGSFFGEWVKLGVFLPAGLVVFGLLGTGVVLWWMPHGARLRKRGSRENRSGTGGKAPG